MMSVFQIEQYYISITGKLFTDDKQQSVRDLLSNEGYSDYEFQSDRDLIVDGIEDEGDANILERKILNLIN